MISGNPPFPEPLAPPISRSAGSGLNLISYFLGEEKLVASATFRSNQLDLQEVLDQLTR